MKKPRSVSRTILFLWLCVATYVSAMLLSMGLAPNVVPTGFLFSPLCAGLVAIGFAKRIRIAASALNILGTVYAAISVFIALGAVAKGMESNAFDIVFWCVVYAIVSVCWIVSICSANSNSSRMWFSKAEIAPKPTEESFAENAPAKQAEQIFNTGFPSREESAANRVDQFCFHPVRNSRGFSMSTWSTLLWTIAVLAYCFLYVRTVLGDMGPWGIGTFWWRNTSVGRVLNSQGRVEAFWLGLVGVIMLAIWTLSIIKESQRWRRPQQLPRIPTSRMRVVLLMLSLLIAGLMIFSLMNYAINDNTFPADPNVHYDP